MESSGESEEKFPRLPHNPGTSVVPLENNASVPLPFLHEQGSLAPISVCNSPNTCIADKVYIQHDSHVYKNMKESTDLKLRTLKESSYMVTRTAKEGSKRLIELGFLLLAGGSQSGKTTTGLQILGRVASKTRCAPLTLDRPEDYMHIPPSEKVVVLIDDIFGRAGMSADSVLKWENVLNDMLHLPRKDNVLLIVTCNSMVLQEAQCWNAPGVLYKPKHAVNLESDMYMIRDYEKYFVLCSFVQKQRLKITDSEVIHLSQSIRHPWFYGCCQYVSSRRMDGETFTEFFRHPFQLHLTRLRALAEREPVRFSTLVLLLKIGSLPDSLRELEQNQIITESLQIIQNTLSLRHPLHTNHILSLLPSLGDYVTLTQGRYTFRHESVEDAVCFLLGQQSLDEMLMWCSDRFLMKHTVLEPQENCLVITESHYPLIKNRLLHNMSSLLFAHPLFSSERFVDGVFGDLSKAISEEDFQQWLLLSIENKLRFTVKKLLPLLRELNTDKKKVMLHSVFEKACSVGDVLLFHELRKLGVKSCETCLQKACQLPRNQVIVGGILFELSIDFEVLSGSCLASCMDYLIKANDQHNLNIILQQLPSRNDNNSLIQKALKSACSSGNVELFHQLKEELVSVDDATLLNFAIDGGHAAIVEWWIETKYKAESRNVNLGHYFLKACILQNTQILDLLVEHDPEVLHAKTSNMDSAVHKATSGTPVVLSWLIERGLDLDCVNMLGQTPLHTACYTGSVQTVMILLENNVCASVQDKNGDTPIHLNLAGPNPSLAIVGMLLSHGADLSTKNHRLNTPLHTICCRKDFHSTIVVAWILERKKNGISCKNSDEQTPLHLMLKTDASDEALELLLGCRVDVNIQNKDKQTPLHIAAMKPKPWVVDVLLNKGCNPLSVDSLGQTALHIAVSLQNESCARILLQWLQKHTLNTSTPSADGRTVVHVAVETPTNLSFFQHLVEGNTQLSPKDNAGRTPLHILSSRCNVLDMQKLNLLLRKGAIVDVEEESGLTPLHCVCMSAGPCKFQMTESLLQYGADPLHQDNNGQNVLHKLCTRSSESDVQTLELLLSKTGTNSKDNMGDTPLHKACISKGEGATQIMQILMDHGAAIEIQNNDGSDVIDACLQQSRSRFHSLLVLVAKTACQSHSQYSCAAVRGLMARGGFSYGTDDSGYTVVHKLCMVNRDRTHEIIDYFLTHGVDVHARTREGKTALHVACMAVGQYTESVLDTLRRRGVDICARDLQGETGLHKVAHVSNRYSMATVSQLGKMGVDPDIRNIDGDTALLVALSSQGDHVKETAKELIALGSDLTVENHHGKSAVDFSSENLFSASDLLHVYCENVQILDINQIQSLISRGADILSQDSQGDTVLHKLCSNKNANTHTNISTLLQVGASVEMHNSNHLSSYDIASFNGQPEHTMKMMLEWNAPASALEQDPFEQADDISLPVDSEEQTTDVTMALVPYTPDSDESRYASDEDVHPLQRLHDQMDERKGRAQDSIKASILSGNYINLVDDLLAVGTAEALRGGLKTLIKRDKKK